jgi:hypothetical protein
VLEQPPVKAKFVVESFQAVGAVGEITGEKIAAGKLKGQHPTLVVKFAIAQAVVYRQGGRRLYIATPE